MSLYSKLVHSLFRSLSPPFERARSGLSLPTQGLLMKIMAPGIVDTIGVSFSELYAQLPAAHQSLYSADGETPYDDETTLANIAGYANLNLEELIGTPAKGYAQYADGTSREILNKALRYFGLPQIVPTIFDKYENTDNYTDLENYI